MTDGQDLALNQRMQRASSGVSEFANIVVARLVASGGRQNLPLDDRMMTRFMEALQNDDASVLQNLRADFRRAGVTPGDLADHYIPEAARRLGVEWLRDGLSFGEVSIASAKLQGLLRQVTDSFVEDERREANGGNVLVVVPEGEQHTLGALVLTSQLRRRGVSVNLQMGQSEHFLTKLVATRQFDGVLISISTTKQ
jgi:MerR family transcriptional regulator, light-induced transcriptional regulator